MSTKKHNSRKSNSKKMARSFAIRLGMSIFTFLVIQNIWISRQSEKQITGLYTQMSTQIALSQAENISRYFENYITDLRIFTDADICKNGSEAQIIAWLEQNPDLKSNSFEYVFFSGKDGLSHHPDGKTASIADSSYYKAIMIDKEPFFISDPMVSRVTGESLVFVARAVYNEKRAICGFFAGALSMGEMQKISNSVKLGNGYAYIQDSAGLIIAHPDRDMILKMNCRYTDRLGYQGLADIAAKMIKGETGSGYITKPDGNKYQIVYTKILQTNGWSMGIAIPNTQIRTVSVNIRNVTFGCSIIVILLMLSVAIITIIRMLKPLKTVQATITDIADGEADLTRTIDIQRNDEIGHLVSGFNRFVSKLHSIVSAIAESKVSLTEIEQQLQQSIRATSGATDRIVSHISNIGGKIDDQSESVGQTASAVTEIAQNLESLENMIQNQASGVTQASAAVEEMISNISAVESSVEKMAERFTSLAENASLGIQKQETVNETVSEIARQSATLMEANSAIASIASQTNLLAMNAAIEAAHAGDAGKGFSVVADEIRKLSETSSSQSKTIGEELQKIQDAIASVVSASKDSEETFATVSTQIQDTDILVRQIHEAMQEQQEGSKQIFGALQIMNNSTSEVRTASAEMTSGNKAILEEVRILQESTFSIKASMSEMSAGAQDITKTEAQLASLSKDVAGAVKKIGNEIDLFKL